MEKTISKPDNETLLEENNKLSDELGKIKKDRDNLLIEVSRLNRVIEGINGTLKQVLVLLNREYAQDKGASNEQSGSN